MQRKVLASSHQHLMAEAPAATILASQRSCFMTTWPGGAGLVAQLERESVFDAVLRNARERVRGSCGCDSSCYGCLRSYRNQFAHSHLNRKQALKILIPENGDKH